MSDPVDYDPLDSEGDMFHPPSLSTLVGCLHCGEVYESYLMVWHVRQDFNDKTHGFWCCPTVGCSGIGFGFDIHPIDDDYQDPDGRDMGHWVEDPPPDPETDFDRPPPDPTPVRCECCGNSYSSRDMVWWIDEDCPEDAFQMSGWMCPHAGCNGMGFGLDVRPSDPAFVDPLGRRLMRPHEKRQPFSPGELGEDDVPF